MQFDLGCVLTVVGEIVPMAFADKETGEDIGYVQLRVPGDLVTMNVNADVARKMKEGEVWEVVGGCMVRKKSGRLHVHEPRSLRRLRAAQVDEKGPKIVFEVPTAATK